MKRMLVIPEDPGNEGEAITCTFQFHFLSLKTATHRYFVACWTPACKQRLASFQPQLLHLCGVLRRCLYPLRQGAHVQNPIHEGQCGKAGPGLTWRRKGNQWLSTQSTSGVPLLENTVVPLENNDCQDSPRSERIGVLLHPPANTHRLEN